MPATELNGKKLASQIEESLKPRIEALEKAGKKPGLAVVLVGSDPASRLYVSKKREACKRLGIHSEEFRFPESVSGEELIKKVRELNEKKEIHGILVQLPLPGGIDSAKAIESIAPEKDVDGFSSKNMGLLALGKEGLVSCTARGVIKLIESTGKKIKGSNACVVGHGKTVGLPLSIMLLNRNATLTVCDRFTKCLESETKKADILISCAGVPSLVGGEMVKEGAIVIDVGINRVMGKLVGDVDFECAKKKAAFITPVPGGVGPMTVACLMENTVIAAEKGVID